MKKTLIIRITSLTIILLFSLSPVSYARRYGGSDNSFISWLMAFAIVAAFTIITAGPQIKKKRTVERIIPVDVAKLIEKNDPTFVEGDFLNMAKDTFERIQDCMALGNMEPVRSYISSVLYESFYKQAEERNKLGHKKHIEERTISKVELINYETDSLNDYVSVRIRATMFEYSLDSDGYLVPWSGSKTSKQTRPHKLGFMRTRGYTENDTPQAVTNCPKCGAPTNHTSGSIRCSYCGNIIISSSHGWVLYQYMYDDNDIANTFQK